ncbi:MAG: hypothetical protein K2M84_01910 [Anaeroplasmataceae bacterium]|nr:hypothetical protein [Anaeroplasmataceae bacterium]
MSRNSNYSSHIDENGFTVIKEDKYFRNLSYFPENWFGECGLITLSILLGYLDTFHNDNFIPNDKVYNGRHYVDNDSVDDDGDLVYDSVNIISEELTRKVKYPYVEGNSYGLESWPTYAMPGTNYAMRDYLLDNYLHTYGIWEKPGIKDLKKNRPSPMADEELKKTFKDYISANCSFLSDDTIIRSGNVFYTHQHPKDYIKSGVPTVLVLADYTQQSRGILDDDWHDVVAYGYKDDQFLVHMGWWPGYQDFAEIVISSATIYAYFALEYTGEHVHSKNVFMEKDNVTYYICGCGYKYNNSHNHTYDYYENMNNDYHLSICSCGISIKEPHEWVFMSGKAMPKPTAKSCKKCGAIVLL